MPNQTGPKTAEGKAKSSQNSLKHGLYTERMFVLSNETPENWDKMLGEWTGKLKPRDEAERLIVVDIAHAQWKLRRSRFIESGIFDGRMMDQMAAHFIGAGGPDEVLRLAGAFTSLADQSKALRELHRYESRARRAFNSGLNALEQLRRIASAEPRQPAEQPKPAPAPLLLAPLPPPPALPPHLKPEWERLARRIPGFSPVRHARRMSGPLRRWCESKAA